MALCYFVYCLPSCRMSCRLVSWCGVRGYLVLCEVVHCLVSLSHAAQRWWCGIRQGTRQYGVVYHLFTACTGAVWAIISSHSHVLGGAVWAIIFSLWRTQWHGVVCLVCAQWYDVMPSGISFRLILSHVVMCNAVLQYDVVCCSAMSCCLVLSHVVHAYLVFVSFHNDHRRGCGDETRRDNTTTRYHIAPRYNAAASHGTSLWHRVRVLSNVICSLSCRLVSCHSVVLWYSLGVWCRVVSCHTVVVGHVVPSCAMMQRGLVV